MLLFVQRIQASPLLVRVVPFVIFIVLTFFQGAFGESFRYWIYLFKTLVGAWLIWEFGPKICEMKWSFSWEAVGVGLAVFGVWVGLDSLYPKMTTTAQPWNPQAQFGSSAELAWLFVFVRIAGSTLIVPPLEEVFYRSFLYRYIAKPEFETIELGKFMVKPFLITAAVFGAAHYEWLSAIFCAIALQALVIRHKRLGDAMTAHAVANLLLGLWVVWKGAWHFW